MPRRLAPRFKGGTSGSHRRIHIGTIGSSYARQRLTRRGINTLKILTAGRLNPLIIDEQANDRQRAALTAFAQHMAGELLRNIEQVIYAPTELAVNHEKHGAAMLRAGRFATVHTRSLNEGDHLCGNEATFYPPLTETKHAMPAVAITDSYRGPGLGTDWELHGKRSAFVGTFAL